MNVTSCNITLPGCSHAHLWRRNPDAVAALLLLHGMESHLGWFDGVARHALAHKSKPSFDVLAYDRRGWGAAPGPRGCLRSPNDALQELYNVVTALQARYTYIHLAGFSWGGLLALLAALKQPSLFASLSLIAPALRLKRDLSYWQKAMIIASMISRIPYRLRTPITPTDLAASTSSLTFIETDTARITAHSTQFYAATHAMRISIKRLLGASSLPPSQILLAEDDTLLDNTATTDLAIAHGWNVALIPSVRHALALEAPSEVAMRLVAHLVKASVGTSQKATFQ